MKINDLILSTRKSNKMTQQELAKKSKISQSLISKIEHGSVNPRYDDVINILKVLNITVKLEGIKK